MAIRWIASCLAVALVPPAFAQDTTETITYRCGKTTLVAALAPREARITLGKGREIRLPGRRGEKRFQYLDRTYEFSGTPEAPQWRMAYRDPVDCTRA